ncbi:unnamed protein product [Brassica rapa subsp. trilocularis]
MHTKIRQQVTTIFMIVSPYKSGLLFPEITANSNPNKSFTMFYSLLYKKEQN